MSGSHRIISWLLEYHGTTQMAVGLDMVPLSSLGIQSIAITYYNEEVEDLASTECSHHFLPLRLVDKTQLCYPRQWLRQNLLLQCLIQVPGHLVHAVKSWELWQFPEPQACFFWVFDVFYIKEKLTGKYTHCQSEATDKILCNSLLTNNTLRHK